MNEFQGSLYKIIWNKMEGELFQGMEFALIAGVIGWLTYVVYQIIYNPRKAYNFVPARLRSWSFLVNLGVTDKSNTFRELDDRFVTLQEIMEAMRSNGLEKANLIIGIDFTASNEWQGRKTFGGRSLHHIDIDSRTGKVHKWNPYQKVIRTIGMTLQDFDEDQQIPVYGFGDEKTRGSKVFPLLNDDSPCSSVDEVLARYTRTVGSVSLSGPTNFAPIIRKAIDIVRETNKYHVLLILADGRVEGDEDRETRKAIVEASNYPLSLVLVGVGDGPWDIMHVYDDALPQRRFDNFQFVEYHEKKGRLHRDHSDTDFAVNALMEIPDQYRTIKALGLLKNNVADCNQNDRSSGKSADARTVYGRHNRRKTVKQTDV